MPTLADEPQHQHHHHHHPHPQRAPPPIPTSTAPVASSSSSISSQPLTVDALLAATPNRDPLLALESLLAERNSLTAQNQQLWKLIEKQKTMYNNATRELDRLRAATDRNGPPVDSLAASTSSGNSRRTEKGEDRIQQRAKLARTNSDDQAVVQKHLAAAQTLAPARSITPARSQELRPNGTSPPPTSLEAKSLAPTNGNTPQRPSRGDSLPNPAPAPINGPESAAAAAAPPAPPVVPLNVQKKSSTTPATNMTPPIVVPTIVSTVEPPSTVTSPATEPPSLPPTATLGVNLVPQRDRRSARESRISLPDEAARYIAAMSDSPLASPGVTNPSAPGVPSSIEQSARDLEFGGSSDSIAADAEATVRGTQTRNAEEDRERTPLATEVSYPAVSERPPVATTGSRPGYVYGANGLGRNGSFDYNEASTPMPTQLTYASQQQQQQQYPPYGAPQPPPRPKLHTQSSGSGGGSSRPSMQQLQNPNGSVVSLPGSQLSSPAEGTPHPASDHSRESRDTYQPSQQSVQAQGFRDAGFYDLGSQAPTQQRTTHYPSPLQSQPPSTPRLRSSQLASTRVRIEGSNIRSNERGKDVLSFLISVHPPPNSHAQNQSSDEWKVEKMYSDVLTLDSTVRNALGRNHAKKLPPLPDAKLFKDNAPAKVDQRRAILEHYLQALLVVPLKETNDICAFFSTGFSRADKAPVMSQGYKEGYLTKRGKNFGGWKTRYFVLQTSVLEYFENRGGTHLGSINIIGSQIGRQQKQASAEDENSYRHAFLIIEQTKKGQVPARHVLCAASDAERDDWVDVLVRSIAPPSGSSYGDESYPQSDSTINDNTPSRPSTSSIAPSELGDGWRGTGPDNGGAGHSPVDRIPGGPQHQSQGMSDAQLAQRILERNAGGPGSTQIGNVAPSTSLPSSLEHSSNQAYQQTRSNSSLGHYTESPKDPRGPSQLPMQETSSPRAKPEKIATRASYHPALSNVKASASSHGPSSASSTLADRDRDDSSAGESTTAGSVLSAGSKKISGPLNAQPIPAGYKFGGNKDSPGADVSPIADRDRKAKSGRFWPTFGKGSGNAHPNSSPHLSTNALSNMPSYGASSRAVFGIPLESSLAVANIANLPAIVFRCIEYLEAKKAAEEEGIYRLSGSSAVIKALKDRFNHDGDVNLLKHDELWDPHAIAGLLKQFLRDLPTSILTRELQQRFLSVVDLMDSNERVNELTHLVSQLPLANYSLLRAMITHLILIVQNSAVNKMTMRNVGIVFSPTLGIPAGILSLMLGEFDRVFNVDGTDGSSDAASSNDHESYAHDGQTPQPKGTSSADRSMGRVGSAGDNRINKRNSMLYNSTDTDRMLGLGSRRLETPEESSDGEVSMPEESDEDTDPEETNSSRQTTSEQTGSGSPPSPAPLISVSYPVTNGDASTTQAHVQGARAVAATRGLQITVGGKGSHRASGLPSSPRPNRYPGSPGHGGMNV